ncbi:MAG: chorismate-binding protein [Actinomycetia bacterium]|nr:chorismate-binding protein [Actinomycetes bacterium]
MFGARFDDIVRGESFVLDDPLYVLETAAVDEVKNIITAASLASVEGKWVAGYVTFEATHAFDPDVPLIRSDSSALVWFGVFGSRRRVPIAVHDPESAGSYAVSQWSPSMSRSTYTKAFDQVQELVHLGSADQVTLAFPLRAAFTGDLDVFYDDLVCAQRPPYASHIWHDEHHILSVSPERLFAVQDGRITTGTTLGTRPRGRWIDEDERHRELLVSSSNARDEHARVVSAVTTSLEGVSVPGSVEASSIFAMERLRTVWQASSTVAAELAPGANLVDVFGALFPSGSVTGFSRTDSVRIITATESGPRGVYGGAIGFIPPGDGLSGSSFNVAIRSVEVDDMEGVASFGVGGTVTQSSDAHREFDLAVAKSEVLRFDVSPLKLVEEIRWDEEYIWRVDHLDRMELSAAYWSFDFDRDALEIVLDEMAAKLSIPSVVRIVCDAKGHADVTSARGEGRWAPGPGPAFDHVTVVLDTEPIDDRNPRLFHSTTDRRPYKARRARHMSFDDVVFVNRARWVTESTNANVVFLFDGTWVTPPVSEGLLGGVMRSSLIEAGTVEERRMSIEQALEADAVALVSAKLGWRPTVLVRQNPGTNGDG